MRPILLLLPIAAACSGGEDACVASGANLVADGGFDQGLDCWTLDGEGTFELVEETGPASTAPAVRIEAPAVGEDPKAVRLISRSGMSMEYTEPLVISFSARSTEVRTIWMRIESIEGDMGDPEWHRAYEYRAVLGSEWEDFRLEFASSDTVEDLPLQVQVGSTSEAPVWIDDLRVERDPQ